MQQITVHSLSWNNIPDAMLLAQRTLFEKLGIPLRQSREDGRAHAAWMQALIEGASPDDVLVFCDTDAFPLTSAAFEQAVGHARAGALFGLAQTANHLGNPLSLYAGPMFLAFQKSTWNRAGSPSVLPTRQFDVAQQLSHAARGRDIEIKLVHPTTCLVPKWPLGHDGVFGYATFYGEREFFHLFEARSPRYLELYLAIAEDVIKDRKPDFAKYLKLVGAPEYPTSPGWTGSP